MIETKRARKGGGSPDLALTYHLDEEGKQGNMATRDCTTTLGQVQARTLFIPGGFRPREELPFGVHKYSAGICVLLDRLVTAIAYGTGDGWVPIHRKSMLSLFGTDRTWDRIRKLLVDRDVMVCDGHYTIGEHPKRYRLSPKWEKVTPVAYELTDPRYIRWLEKADNDRVKSERWLPVHHGLHEWVKAATFDMLMAEAILAQMPEEKRRLGGLTVAMTNSGGRVPSVDEFGRRFHTVITNMPRVLRPALRINGEPLVEVDIANCQPLLLGLTTAVFPVHPSIFSSEIQEGKEGERERKEKKRRKEEEREKEGEKGKREGKEGEAAPTGAASLITHSQNTTTDASIIERDPLPADLIRYIDACISGRYYETFAEVVGMRCETPEQRDRVKKASCVLMFDVTHPFSERWRRFAAEWPTAADRLLLLKRHDHREVARELQRAESDVMLQGVCWALLREIPRIPILTIHDALLVPAWSLVTVQRVIRRVWSRIGFAPHLKIGI